MLCNRYLERTLRMYGSESNQELARQKMLHEAKRLLNEREYHVVTRTMESTHNGYRKAIADELKCSPAAVSNIQRDAFTKLRPVSRDSASEYSI